MTSLHLAYLQQLSDQLEDRHKPLAARFGYIAKKIASKHLVHIKGVDPPKLRRCKACQAPITCDNVRSKNKLLIITCPLCGLRRNYSNSRVNTETKKRISEKEKRKRDKSKKEKKRKKKKAKRQSHQQAPDVIDNSKCN